MRVDSRVVIDTNVLVSALFVVDSPPALCVRHVMRPGTLLVSEHVFQEYEEVLMRARFDRYSSRDLREALLEGIAVRAELVEVKVRQPKPETQDARSTAGQFGES
ncbi:MAG: putative toxin-antitoxin system toxin component, PIN family [Fimbriimonadales bacterium]